MTRQPLACQNLPKHRNRSGPCSQLLAAFASPFAPNGWPQRKGEGQPLGAKGQLCSSAGLFYGGALVVAPLRVAPCDVRQWGRPPTPRCSTVGEPPPQWHSLSDIAAFG